MRIKVWRAAVLLIGYGHRTGFTCKHCLILWRTRLAWWPRWACLIRIARRSGLTWLTLTCGPGLSTLTWRTLLALGFGKRRIHVAVYVPRFVIVVTAVAAAIAIVHVIHFSEP